MRHERLRPYCPKITQRIYGCVLKAAFALADMVFASRNRSGLCSPPGAEWIVLHIYKSVQKRNEADD